MCLAWQVLKKAAELELLCAKHPEIKSAVEEFENLIEKQAFKNAVPPPADMKSKLMMELADEFASEDKDEKNKAVLIPFSNIRCRYRNK